MRWAPSKHRSLHGDREDHGMVASTWKWKIRSVKPQPKKDFSVLKQPEMAAKFDRIVEEKLAEQGCTRDTDPNATELYNYMSTAIHHAIETVLPDVLRSPGIKSEVSEATKELYEKREKMKGCTQGQCDSLQK